MNLKNIKHEEGCGCEAFKVGRATHGAFADGLGVNPKAHPRKVHASTMSRKFCRFGAESYRTYAKESRVEESLQFVN